MTDRHIIKDKIRSNTVKMPSVPRKAVHILTPAAITTAVMMEVPPPVIPPYNKTTTGAERIIVIADMMHIEMGHFHQEENIFLFARNPVTSPTPIFTMIKGKTDGLITPDTKFDSAPVAAPTQGPHNMDQ